MRMYPTYGLGCANPALFAETVGAICRAVWNAASEQRREYRRRGAWIG
jgi:hypothetical protein